MRECKTHRYTTNKSQEVSPFPAGDHIAQINRRAQRHSKHDRKTLMIHKRNTAAERSVKIFYWRAQTGFTAPISTCKEFVCRFEILASEHASV